MLKVWTTRAVKGSHASISESLDSRGLRAIQGQLFGRSFRCLTSSNFDHRNSSIDENNAPQKVTFTELPPPSWSIASLELDKQHKPVSEEELEVLAKRALIELPKDNVSSANLDTDQLRQDLGNMLHMVRQVQGFASDDSEALSSEDVYDAPRGVRSAPVRRHGSTEEEEREAEQVWKSLLETKTSLVGAHPYFVIATKEENNDSKTPQ
jgi:hypothetical protein